MYSFVQTGHESDVGALERGWDLQDDWGHEAQRELKHGGKALLLGRHGVHGFNDIASFPAHRVKVPPKPCAPECIVADGHQRGLDVSMTTSQSLTEHALTQVESSFVE